MRRPSRAAAVATVLAALLIAVLLGAVEDSESAALQKSKPRCLGKQATVVGNGKANTLTGTRRNDVIVGLGGNDTINGLAGNDLVCGGAGADKLAGGTGADRLDGGAGSDTCRTGERLVSCEETRPDAVRGPLSPGAYVTDVFRPRFGFVVGSGWSIAFVESKQLLLAQRTDPGALSLTFDSFAARQSVAATIARFAGTPGVEAGAPATATIGGSSGQRIELRVTGGETSVPGLSDRYELESNDRVRAYAVEVGGVTVSILVEAPTAESAAFFAEAERVLDSLRWG